MFGRYSFRSRRNKPQKKYVNTTSTRYVRERKSSVNYGIVILAAVLVTVVALSAVFIIAFGKDGKTEPTYTREPDKTADDSGSENGFITVSVNNSAIHTGDLILVNHEHEYVFPKEPENIKLYGNKSSSYKVSGDKLMLRKKVVGVLNKLMDDFYSETGCGDALVNSAFRDYDEQKSLYDERVAKYGAREAADYVSLPGFSEHHTGLAIDFSIYTSDGKSYTFGTYDQAEWLRQHFTRYGFILRYPSDKVDITRIKYEGWHYRYVGVAHAMIMDSLGCCLEEYIELLKNYSADGRYLALLPDGDAADIYHENGPKYVYAVYYVPASAGELTDIPIPEGAEYEISGTNTDGFAVVLRGELDFDD